MEENRSKNFIVRVGDNSIVRYSNALVRRALEEVTKVDCSIKEVKIGEQIWMAENLNVDHFRNGDSIPEVSDPDEWAKLTTGAWCYYENDPENGKKYGKLYNWYAVNDPRGLAPESWHIPSEHEFAILEIAVDNDADALKAIGEGIDDGSGTNTSGFSALLSGNRFDYGRFYNLGFDTYFWGSTEDDHEINYMCLSYYGSNIYVLNDYYEAYGLSVRCVKDESCALQKASDIQKEIELYPDDAEACFNRGCTKYGLEDYTGAIQDYNKAIELEPNDAMAYYDRGLAKYYLDQYKSAIQDYNKAIEIYPDYANSYFMRGLAKGKLEDHKGEIQDCSKAIKVNPNYAEAYNNRGLAKANLKDYIGAIQDYDKVIEINPNDADAYYNRGVARGKLENHIDAIQDYNKAIELNPNDADAYFMRGFAKIDLKEYVGAMKDCNKAIELNPDNADDYYELRDILKNIVTDTDKPNH
ncbi:MAG: hypothetical protein C0417_10530 [Chlorobiaceae bacterium]|nr:hypothetical protein [Chlorobiaceae bacterium]